MRFALPFSEKVNRILAYSQEEAQRFRKNHIEPEHLMLGILKEKNNKAAKVLSEKFLIDIDEYCTRLETALARETDDTMFAINTKRGNSDDILVTDDTTDVLRLGMLEAKVMRSKEIGAEHLLLGILKQNRNEAASMLHKDYDIDYDKVYMGLCAKTKTKTKTRDDVDVEDDDEDDDGGAPPSRNGKQESGEETTKTKTKTKKGSDTPALDAFSTDITQMAREDRLDPVVGREKETERIAQILSRRKKNNPILIGEPGVGKSAIVEGLARRINDRSVPRTLVGKRLLSLDMSLIVAGTKYRGQFEERMKSIITELKKSPDVIVFIDEIHNLIGAGNQAGQMDAANMLKPALARGEVQCIGATTLDEYRKSIEKDGALERRFQKVIVDPTSTSETLEILKNIKYKYEEHHNVTYTDEALRACVNLTERYVTDRSFPDKAIDAMDEAGSRIHIHNITVPKEIEEQEEKIDNVIIQKEAAVKDQNFELAAQFRDQERNLNDELKKMRKKWSASQAEERTTVDAEQVAETVSLITGIPVTKMAQDEGIRLKGMREALKHRVIAQDPAIDRMVNAIQRSRVGLKDPNRPIGTFMFLGPTGVGKTYLAKELAKYMFGSEDALIRIDMSEYMEKFTVSRLVGAPPGYVGYEEGGMLTEKVRRKPYSIVLLDEIEKAHQDVFNILLQVLDDGRLTDSYGKTVDFRNTVVIMTSNVGTRQLKDFGAGIGFSSGDISKTASDNVIRKALNKQFSPEFLNRIDDIITFDQLTEADIQKIVDIELTGLLSRIGKLGYTIDITPEVKAFLAHKGYDRQMGARPLRRAIQQYLEDPLSELIVENTPEAGSCLSTKVEGERIAINPQQP